MLVHTRAHNALFIASHGDNQDKPAARAAHRAYTKLLAHLRSGDAIAAQDFWRKHLDGIEKYMVGDSATTLVEVLPDESAGARRPARVLSVREQSA